MRQKGHIDESSTENLHNSSVQLEPSFADFDMPATYFPWKSGVYEVAPSLRPLSTDFGNGPADRKLLQIDRLCDVYWANKVAILNSDRKRLYMGEMELDPLVEKSVAKAISAHLAHDFPSIFAGTENRIESKLNRAFLEWDQAGKVVDFTFPGVPGSGRLFELIGLFVQADFAIVCQGDRRDWVAAVNVCAPSHWRPAEKLGQSFLETHEPVPGFHRVAAVAPKMVGAMIEKGPFVRFVWGIESDDRLDHHPVPPPNEDPVAWDGRRWPNGAAEPFWARYERQTLLGLPEVGAALFVIHPKLMAGSAVLSVESQRRSLRRALLGMSKEARVYKGLEQTFDALLAEIPDDL